MRWDPKAPKQEQEQEQAGATKKTSMARRLGVWRRVREKGVTDAEQLGKDKHDAVTVSINWLLVGMLCLVAVTIASYFATGEPPPIGK